MKTILKSRAFDLLMSKAERKRQKEELVDIVEYELSPAYITKNYNVLHNSQNGLDNKWYERKGSEIISAKIVIVKRKKNEF